MSLDRFAPFPGDRAQQMIPAHPTYATQRHSPRPVPRHPTGRASGLLAVAVLLVFVSVGRAHDFLARLTGPVPAGKILISIGLAILLLRAKRSRILRAMTTPQGKSFVLLAAAMIASVPFSIYRTGALQSLTETLPSIVAIVLITVAAAETSWCVASRSFISVSRGRA